MEFWDHGTKAARSLGMHTAFGNPKSGGPNFGILLSLSMANVFASIALISNY